MTWQGTSTNKRRMRHTTTIKHKKEVICEIALLLQTSKPKVLQTCFQLLDEEASWYVFACLVEHTPKASRVYRHERCRDMNEGRGGKRWTRKWKESTWVVCWIINLVKWNEKDSWRSSKRTFFLSLDPPSRKIESFFSVCCCLFPFRRRFGEAKKKFKCRREKRAGKGRSRIRFALRMRKDLKDDFNTFSIFRFEALLIGSMSFGSHELRRPLHSLSLSSFEILIAISCQFPRTQLFL